MLIFIKRYLAHPCLCNNLQRNGWAFLKARYVHKHYMHFFHCWTPLVGTFAKTRGSEGDGVFSVACQRVCTWVQTYEFLCPYLVKWPCGKQKPIFELTQYCKS